MHLELSANGGSGRKAEANNDDWSAHLKFLVMELVSSDRDTPGGRDYQHWSWIAHTKSWGCGLCLAAQSAVMPASLTTLAHSATSDLMMSANVCSGALLASQPATSSFR